MINFRGDPKLNIGAKVSTIIWVHFLNLMWVVTIPSLVLLWKKRRKRPNDPSDLLVLGTISRSKMCLGFTYLSEQKTNT